MNKWHEKITGNLNGKELTSTIVLIWIIIVWMAVFNLPSHFQGNYLPIWMYQVKAAGLFTINALIGLYIEDKRDDYERVFTTIWRIKTLETDPQITLNLIIDTLDANTELWCKITDKINKAKQDRLSNVRVRNDILTFNKVYERALCEWRKVFIGSLTFLQTVWLFGYCIYVFIISTNIMKLAAPVDMLISLGFFLILTFTNKTEGLGEFLNELHTSLLNVKESDMEIALQTVEKKIKKLARDYYLIYNIIENTQQLKKGG